VRAAGHTERTAPRQAGFGVLAAGLLALALLALAAAPAAAQQTHLRLETFPPIFNSSNSLTVDQSTGDLLVIDAGATTVSRWNPDGTPASFSALGTNVIDAKGAGDGTPEDGFSFTGPAGEQQVAVDNSGTATDGDIYVTQQKNDGSLHLVDVFASSGEYKGQLNGTGATAFGENSRPCGVAVDPAGRVFVADRLESKIYEYASQGAPHNPLDNNDWVETFSVSKPCSLAAGAGPSAGFLFINKFFSFEGNSVLRLTISSGALGVVDPGEDRLVAVDPATGHLYAAVAGATEVTPGEKEEAGTVRELDASGPLPAKLVSSIPTGKIKGIAVRGSTGEIYVSNEAGFNSLQIGVYGPLTTIPDVTTGVATVTGNTSATLKGTVNPDGVALEECFFSWGKTTSYEHPAEACESPAAGEITGSSPVAVHVEIGGLETCTTYHYRLAANNANAALYPEDPHATPKGADRTFSTPCKPTLEAEWTASAGLEEATLKATINPENAPTTYSFEWGPETSYGHTVTGTVGADATVHTIAVTLTEGLAPGSTYHFRFSAENHLGEAEGGDRAFHTYLPTLPETGCANDALRAGAAALLPDCRAYELVSPPAKEGGEAGVPSSYVNAGGIALTVQPRQASPAGEAITYGSFTAFGAEPESAPATSQYLSSRQPGGWSTDNVDPRYEEGFLSDPFVGFSADLSHGAARVVEPELTEDAAKDVPNLYWRESASGALTAIVTAEHQPQIASLPGRERYCLSYGGASADSEQVFFAAKGALLEGDLVRNGFNLYEFSAARAPAEALRLISVLPNGTRATPTLDTGFGGSSGEAGCSMQQALLRRAISAGGQRVFWTYAHSFSGGNNPLFARVSGGPGEPETVQLDASQGGAGKGEGRYWDASLNGSKAFFTDTQKLTPGSTAAGGEPDLYRYDFEASPGARLTDLTAPQPIEAENVKAGVKGVIGASAEGDYVYFVATGKLTGEEENAAHEKAQSGQNNLYAWHEGEGIRFIATLAPGLGDSSDWSADPSNQTARLTPDGAHLAFPSTKSLTGYDNTEPDAGACGVPAVAGEGCNEAYIYDFEADSLACASCNPTGARPLGRSSVLTWSAPYEQPRYLSDNGDRLFFESLDALALRDTNGKRDVYEWEAPGAGSCVESSPTFSAQDGGCLYLISSGAGSDESFFLDASSEQDGRDAFFSTRRQLAPQDEDERFDVYDARAGGGFPYQPPVECEGEGCRGEGTGAGPGFSPGTSAFQGPGNQAHPRCPKGKRQVRSHGKTRCVKPKKHRRAGR
jgi:hypothetical protein